MRKVKFSYLFLSGMVATFDVKGDQIPELQGEYSERLEEKIRRRSLPDAVLCGFPGKEIREYTECPHCGTSLEGEDIFEVFKRQRDEEGVQCWQGLSDEELMQEVKESYSPPYKFKRHIFVHNRGGADFFMCPDCRKQL